MNDERTVFVHPRQIDGTAVRPMVFRSLSEAREALRCTVKFKKARIEIYVTDENLDHVLS